MYECLTLTDSVRLCTTLCPESDSLSQSLTESDTTAIEPKVSETGTLPLRLGIPGTDAHGSRVPPLRRPARASSRALWEWQRKELGV